MSTFVDYALKNIYPVEENIEHACTILKLTLELSASERYSDNADIAVAFEKMETSFHALLGIHETLSDILWDMKTLKSREPAPHDRYFLFENNAIEEVSSERYVEAGGTLALDEHSADQDTFTL